MYWWLATLDAKDHKGGAAEVLLERAPKENQEET